MIVDRTTSPTQEHQFLLHIKKNRRLTRKINSNTQDMRQPILHLNSKNTVKEKSISSFVSLRT